MAAALHHSFVVAPGATPAKWTLFLHGILGSGNNLRTLAKGAAAARPDWGFVLVDLRMHGASQGFAPPHDIAAAARDLVALEEVIARPVRGVLGHSFGGKVALEHASRQAAIDCVVVVDANPGVRDPARLGSMEIVGVLASLPDPLPSRERFLALLAERGIDRPTAEWLAMNLRRDGDVYRLRLDLKAIRDLLEDYCRRDFWPYVEAPRQRIDFVVGGRSEGFPPEDRERLAAIAARVANVKTHVSPNAGHWVHVDDPRGLLDVVVGSLP